MAVELVEKAAPPHHNRDTHPCCVKVRDAAALIRKREQALLAASHAINATKEEMDEEIREAEQYETDFELFVPVPMSHLGREECSVQSQSCHYTTLKVTLFVNEST